MKKKTKISLAISTITILSLMLTAYQVQPQILLKPPDVCPVSALTESNRDKTPSTDNKTVVTVQSAKTSTPNENFLEPAPDETTPTQPTEKEKSTNPPTPPTQTATKPTKLIPSEPSTPQMGDTRVVDGQKQSSFLGFGWIKNKGENEYIYVEGMYENGIKIGIMGQSDGDINKMVGTMD